MIVSRLNETTLKWSFTIKDRIVEETEVAVLGSLTIEGIVKQAWGSSFREGKTLGDALKSSASLSLSKCCSLLGMPVIFNNSQPQQQSYQISAASPQHIKEQHGCMVCGNPISAAEVNFSHKYSNIFNGKELCRNCQREYRQSQNIRRVK